VTFTRVNRDFRLLFAAAAVSRLGTSVSYVAMPLIAVTALHATPGEVGLLATLSTLAFLVIGLPAGAWTDRVRRRGVLVAADLARAALLCSVPVAWWLDVLHIGQLYVVVLLCGVGTVFFDVANQSYVPQVVGRSALLAANTRLVSVDAVNDIAGRGVAGYLVALVTAPVAVLVDVATYLVSAWCVLRVRHREAVPATTGTRLWRDMTEGIAFVARHPVLRAIAMSGSLVNLGIVLIVTMLPVVLVDEMGLSPTVLGLFLATGGVGTLLGSLVARRLAAVVGAGRLSLLGAVVATDVAGRRGLGGADRGRGHQQRAPGELSPGRDARPAAGPDDGVVPLPADGGTGRGCGGRGRHRRGVLTPCRADRRGGGHRAGLGPDSGLATAKDARVGQLKRQWPCRVTAGFYEFYTERRACEALHTQYGCACEDFHKLVVRSA
jgi:MFS family permease